MFLRVLIWVTNSAFLLAFLINQACEGKRGIFLPTYVLERVGVSTHNIYASEDALFKLIGRHKTPEFALDTAGFIFFTGIVAAGFSLWTYYYASSVRIAFLISLSLSIVWAVWIVILMNRRWR